MVRAAPCWIAVVATIALGPAACRRDSARRIDPPVLSQPTAERVGLSDQERAEFYHLEEGSEVFPLDMFLALERADGNGLFADGLDRYGFLPDPRSAANPHGLPVGITAATTRDLQFLGIKMVGVNCAACHVAELQHGTTRVRLDGAGGRADINAFYQGLGEAAKATVTSPVRFLKFAFRLRSTSNNPVIASGTATRSAQAMRALPDVTRLESGTAFDQELYRELLRVVSDEAARPPIDIVQNLTLKPGPAEIAARAALTAKLQEGMTPQALAPRIRRQPLRGSTIARGVPGQDVRESSAALLSDVGTTFRLLKARLQFLMRIAERMNVNATPAGFGRIDAFGGARNLLFAGQQPLDAPVSYPHLWNFERLDWLHWDANTTSVLERNIGQALGLGAVVHPQTFQSTVSVVNLFRLEQLARKIRPPRWEDAFGPIDQAAANRGAVLFQTQCASCHAADPNSPDRILALDRIGTDRRRSVNFAVPAGTTPNDRAIADFMGRVKQRAFEEKGFTREQQKLLEGGREARWRLTEGYVARPLIAVWAAAPYLHNNSVPTLDDLLLPPERRPAVFFAGSREYDPVRLGFVSDKALPGTSRLDTSLPGNANTGHPWGPRDKDPEVERKQRADLLEFLKRF
jgi:mono/diheme cytochrome c family protein